MQLQFVNCPANCCHRPPWQKNPIKVYHLKITLCFVSDKKMFFSYLCTKKKQISQMKSIKNQKNWTKYMRRVVYRRLLLQMEGVIKMVIYRRLRLKENMTLDKISLSIHVRENDSRIHCSVSYFGGLFIQ